MTARKISQRCRLRVVTAAAVAGLIGISVVAPASAQSNMIVNGGAGGHSCNITVTSPARGATAHNNTCYRAEARIIGQTAQGALDVRTGLQVARNVTSTATLPAGPTVVSRSARVRWVSTNASWSTWRFF